MSMIHYFYFICLSLFTCLLPILFSFTFYFTDDYQTQYLPTYIEIGRILSNGEFPLVTTNSWMGGGILKEYQYAIFNPICLFVYFVIYKLNTLNIEYDTIAIFFPVFHLILTSLGIFILCRFLKINLFASYFAGLSILHSGYLVFFVNTSWVGMLIGIPYLIFAIIAFLKCETKEGVFFSIICTYLVITSGFPQNDILLGIVCIICMYFFYKENKKGVSVVILFSFCIGCLLGSVSILPLIEFMPFSGRSGMEGNMLQGRIEHLLASGLLSFRPLIKTFYGDWEIIKTPIQYISWFSPIVIVLYAANRDSVKTNNIIKAFILLTVLMAVLYILPLPTYIRWSFRFIPGFHISLIILSILIITYVQNWDKFLSKNVIKSYCFLMFMLGINSYRKSTPSTIVFLFIILFIFYMIRNIIIKNNNGFFWVQRFSALIKKININEQKAWIFITIVSTFFFIFMLFFAKPLLPNFKPSKEYITHNYLQHQKNDSILYIMPIKDQITAESYHKYYIYGSTNLYNHYKAINGYSPFSFKNIDVLCTLTWNGKLYDVKLCLNNIFEIKEPYQLALIELMGVNKIIIPPKYINMVDQIKTNNWFISYQNNEVVVYENKINKFPNCDSNAVIGCEKIFGYIPNGLNIYNVKFQENKVTFNFVTNETYKEIPILLERSFLPGYFYQINKGIEQEAITVFDIIPGVVIPKQQKGFIEIYYDPKSLRYGYVFFIIAILLSMLLIYQRNNIELFFNKKR